MLSSVALPGSGVDCSSLYRRAEVERRIARGVFDGKDSREICELLGMPNREVSGIIEQLARRAQSEAGEIARVHAVKQTGALQSLYLACEKEWQETHDPRYAEQMRQSLADIRKIWGVDAPQRATLGVVVANRGVLGGALEDMTDEELDFLTGILARGGPGAGSNGEGLPALEGVCEADFTVSVGGGEAP